MASDITLKLNELSSVTAWSAEYNEAEDTLYLRTGDPRPATSVDLDGEVWARVDPATGDVVGFDIEGFRAVFIPHHPALARPSMCDVHSASEQEHWLDLFFSLVKESNFPRRRATA